MRTRTPKKQKQTKKNTRFTATICEMRFSISIYASLHWHSFWGIFSEGGHLAIACTRNAMQFNRERKETIETQQTNCENSFPKEFCAEQIVGWVCDVCVCL